MKKTKGKKEETSEPLEEPKQSDPVNESLAEILVDCFKPGKATDFDYSQSTLSVFNQFQKILPSNLYSAHDIYLLLKQNGFVHDKIGGEMEWLFKL